MEVDTLTHGVTMWWGDHVVTMSVDSPGQPALGMARGRLGL